MIPANIICLYGYLLLCPIIASCIVLFRTSSGSTLIRATPVSIAAFATAAATWELLLDQMAQESHTQQKFILIN